MDIHISDEAQSAARDCRKQLACLTQGRKNFCNPEECVNGKILFVKCPKNEHCPYQQAFGDSFFCSCKVRIEIFNKYKI